MIKKKLCCLGFTLTESCTSTDFRMIMSLWSLFLVSGNATFPFCIFISKEIPREVRKVNNRVNWHATRKENQSPFCLLPGGVGVDDDVAEVDETLADVVVVVVDVLDDEDVPDVDAFEVDLSLTFRDEIGTVGPFLMSTFNDLFKI